MPLVLTPATDPAAGGPLSIDLAGISPDRLAGLSLADVRRMPIRADNQPCPRGDLFALAGPAADSRHECPGDI